AHDFLWRVHAKTPARGQMTIFNRSHDEDVLVVRVLELVKKKVWKKRYDEINEFEELLAESGTIILKFFLHIDGAEQEKRLLEREEDQTKAWKLSAGDWQNREHWAAYSAAYEDAINKCAAKHAPWYVVPANRKWFRNLAIAEAIVETLRPYKQGWLDKLAAVGQAEKEKIEAFRREKP
ncbi:MAG: polyphosphate kinase 2 family protein, partial [Blastocatellia bacterium]